MSTYSLTCRQRVLSDSRITNISNSITYKMAAKTSWHIDIERNYVTVTPCISSHYTVITVMVCHHHRTPKSENLPLNIMSIDAYLSVRRKASV